MKVVGKIGNNAIYENVLVDCDYFPKKIAKVFLKEAVTWL